MIQPTRKLLPFLSLAVVVTACTPAEETSLNGYVETQPVRLVAPLAGRLLSVTAVEGQRIEAGQLAFTQEQDSEQHGVAEAAARLQQAESQRQDLLSGKRPEELGSFEAAVRAAEAALRASEADLKRQTELEGGGYVSRSVLDVMKARRDADAAQVAQAQSQLAAARLAARDDTINAARAGEKAAAELLAQKQWLLAQKQTTAQVSGRIEQVYYREGEWVAAGSPVVSIIDNGAVKVRFFIPEKRLAEFPQGKAINVHCDGCEADIPATITYVAKAAEFTPPVMYNNDNRARLVWMAEARPPAEYADKLRPGQPVDVVAAP